MDDGKKVESLERQVKDLMRQIRILLNKDAADNRQIKSLKNRVTQLEATVEALRRRG